MINEENRMNDMLKQANPGLKMIFLRSEYHVFDPPLTIVINAYNPEIDALLKNNQVTTWAFITAYNPSGCLQDEGWNEKQNYDLQENLSEYIFFRGVGQAGDKSWREPSFLVLGISTKDAVALGKKYAQAAILFGIEREKCRLIFVG